MRRLSQRKRSASLSAWSRLASSSARSRRSRSLSSLLRFRRQSGEGRRSGKRFRGGKRRYTQGRTSTSSCGCHCIGGDGGGWGGWGGGRCPGLLLEVPGMWKSTKHMTTGGFFFFFLVVFSHSGASVVTAGIGCERGALAHCTKRSLFV